MPHNTIVIIDDSRTKRNLLTRILQHDFSVKSYESGREAIPHMLADVPELVILDMEMPGENGFEVLHNIKSESTLKDVPVIFLTVLDDRYIEAECLRLGAVDYISNNFLPETVLARVKLHLELQLYRKDLERVIRQQTRAIERLQDGIIISLSDLVECRDEATFGHAYRTSLYMDALCNAMRQRGVYADELTPEKIVEMVRAAPLHDIGKIGIPDIILNKHGKLSGEEISLMQRHTVIGGTAIQRAIRAFKAPSFLDVVKDIVMFHHERWDGEGYPDGLSGGQIPLGARILAVCDVYDALSSVRPYKDAMPHMKVMEIIREESGRQFDPAIVSVFLDIHREFEAIRHRQDFDEWEEQNSPRGHYGLAHSG